MLFIEFDIGLQDWVLLDHQDQTDVVVLSVDVYHVPHDLVGYVTRENHLDCVEGLI